MARWLFGRKRFPESKTILLILILYVLVVMLIHFSRPGYESTTEIAKPCENSERSESKGTTETYHLDKSLCQMFLFTSTRCENLIAETRPKQNQSVLLLCPEQPPHLVGNTNIKPTVTVLEATNMESLMKLSYGGRYAPDCHAREKTAIIIPYRDRRKHLEILVRHLHAILQRQQLEYGIYVVEMALPTQFNRGLLANAGVRTAREITNYTCYVIHDVDLLMTDDRNLYRCGSQPIHFMTGSTKYANNSIPYPSYHGGVIGFTVGQYKNCNGFSNLYFGWGREDDDLGIRVNSSGMIFVRPKEEIGKYVALPHDRDVSNQQNPHRHELEGHARARWMEEGLETIEFRRFALEFRNLYTWMLVGVNESEIIMKYQKYLHKVTSHAYLISSTAMEGWVVLLISVIFSMNVFNTVNYMGY